MISSLFDQDSKASHKIEFLYKRILTATWVHKVSLILALDGVFVSNKTVFLVV